jgi:hypothetical protein
MKQVHQHPDGMIFVRVDGTTYADTAENFAIDFGFLLPEIPAGMNERIYEQNRRHLFAGRTDTGAVTMGDVMPWPLGDRAILDIEMALSAQAVRKAVEEADKVALTPTFDMGGTTAQVIGS